MQLSPLQRRLWWINESSLQASGFNIALLLETTAEVTADWIMDIESRCVAFGLGNYSLNYAVDTLAWQREAYSTLRIEHHDARQYDPSHPSALERAEHLAQHHFDLTNEAPLRLHIIYDEDKTYLLLVACHIVFDGVSMALLLAGLASRPSIEAQFGLDNFALYPPAEAKIASETSVQLWKHRLAGIEQGRLSLPAQPSDVAIVEMPAALVAHIRQFCHAKQVKQSTWMLAQWAEYLQKRCDKKQINIGTVFENRHSESSKRALGLHVSLVPLLISSTHISDIEAQIHGVREYPFVPFEQLAELPEFSEITTWFDCFFGFHHWPRVDYELLNLPWNLCVFSQNVARYPLAIDVFRLGNKYQIKIEKLVDLNGLSSRALAEDFIHFVASRLSHRQENLSSANSGEDWQDQRVVS